MPAPSPLAGILLGLTVGWIGFRAMRSIDEYNLEVMISLAIVVGGNSLAGWLHVSGPVAMAVAGLLIGNAGVTLAMRMWSAPHSSTMRPEAPARTIKSEAGCRAR